MSNTAALRPTKLDTPCILPHFKHLVKTPLATITHVGAKTCHCACVLHSVRFHTLRLAIISTSKRTDRWIAFDA
eukprot:6579711-Lingulodinium_polyedra.AAC.1